MSRTQFTADVGKRPLTEEAEQRGRNTNDDEENIGQREIEDEQIGRRLHALVQTDADQYERIADETEDENRAEQTYLHNAECPFVLQGVRRG